MTSPVPAAGPSASDELACLEAMRRGDPGCLGGFFEAWGDRLYRLSLRLTGDPTAAEDVVQEAFLKLMAGADAIEGRSRLATWLYRVAYNASIDRLRDRKRVVAVPEEDDEDVPMPSLLVDFRLSPEEMLRDAEAAEALSVTETNLKVRLHRARLLLRERLSAFVTGRPERREGRA